MQFVVFALGFRGLRRNGLIVRLVLAVCGADWGGAVWAGEAADAGTSPVTFIFTSDVHFGINRGKFRGAANVEAREVSAAMVEAINALPMVRLPDDGGLRAGRPVGPVDFVTITGDLTNRQDRLPLKIQSASTSWAQFESVFFGGLRLKDGAGRPTPLLLVPGNHDVSNAVGHPDGLMPATDATTMAEIFNRMTRPAVSRTKETYNYETDKIYYAKTFGGVRCFFVTMWPDSIARAWMEQELKQIPATMPVLLFAHDPPQVDARHFTNPHGDFDINPRDRFENVIGDVYAGGQKSDGSTEFEQRIFAAFLKAHRNIVGYFHGHANFHECYTWKGPDKDLALHVFRADSPVKGRESGKDETKASFQVVVFDAAARKLTAREYFWNHAEGLVGMLATLAWGRSTTVSLAPR